MTTDFLSETMQMRRWRSNIFLTTRRKKPCQYVYQKPRENKTHFRHTNTESSVTNRSTVIKNAKESLPGRKKIILNGNMDEEYSK